MAKEKRFNIAQFATNAEAEREGRWVDAGGGLELKIARLGNTDYEDYLRKITKPYQRQIRLNTVDNDTLEGLLRKAIAKHILLDWKNLDDAEGKPIAFTEDKALELLSEYREFYKIVMELAGEVELFRDESLEDSEGNSEKD